MEEKVEEVRALTKRALIAQAAHKTNLTGLRKQAKNVGEQAPLG